MGKYVVAVFCDLCKHSQAWNQVPRDQMAGLIGEYKALAEKVANQYGSFHSNFTGDGHLFLFENADAAVRFGLKVIAAWRDGFENTAALRGLAAIPLRVGAHFGEDTEIGNGDAWVGRANNVAKRIEGAAKPDSVVVSEGILDLLDLPYYHVEPSGIRKLDGDCVARRTLYHVIGFDEVASGAKPEEELTAGDWFLRGVAIIGTPQENTDAEAYCYEQALRLRPDFPEAHNNYAVLLKVRHDFKGADARYQEALRLRPDYAEAHYNYANLLEEQGDAEGAEAHYQEALRLRPDYPKAHNNYALLLKKRDDFKGAEAHYQEALRLRPDYPEAHNNYAILLKKRDDFKGAEAHYREALRLRPDYPTAHYNYAILLNQQGHVRKAKQHFEQAFQLAPDDPDILDAHQRRVWRK